MHYLNVLAYVRSHDKRDAAAAAVVNNECNRITICTCVRAGINLYLIHSLSYAPALAICCIAFCGDVLLDRSVPAALGLGSRINYNPLLRIEINDIGFVFYVGMGLLAMRGLPLDGRVNAVGVNWYRRSLRNDGNEANAQRISLTAEQKDHRKFTESR